MNSDFASLVDTLPEGFPYDHSLSASILKEAKSICPLDPQLLFTRLVWLAGFSAEGGVRILEDASPLSPHQIAAAVAQPQDLIVDMIRRKTGLTTEFLVQVYQEILTKGFADPLFHVSDLTSDRALQEMKWWFTDLQFPEYYLKNTPAELMARQILLNRSYELSGPDSENYTRMNVTLTAPDGTTMYWAHRLRGPEIEEEIEAEIEQRKNLFDVITYAPISDLLLYTVYRHPVPAGAPEADFQAVAPGTFLKLSDAAALERYRELRASVLAKETVVVRRDKKVDTGEFRVMIGFPQGFFKQPQANVSRLLANAGLEVTRKYTHTFGGPRPVILATLYSMTEFPEDLEARLVEMSMVPAGVAAQLLQQGELAPFQATFLRVLTVFVHQFISVPNPDLGFLFERVRTDPDLTSVLRTLQKRLDRDTFRSSSVEGILAGRPDLIRELWKLFAARFDPDRRPDGLSQFSTLMAALPTGTEESQVFQCAARLIDAVARTNFFLPVKGALSFKLNNAFFSQTEAAQAPFGVFMVVGRNFHGFHVRFRDIARGGIRIVRSRTPDDWQRDCDSLFEECYNLATTQDKKNKDIPEGGAKGILLPDFGSSDSQAQDCFRRYVDAVLDLLLPAHSDRIVGWKEEILFFGPDEGSAELMDWACKRARERGYRFWKGFTTGKGAELGGISHIDYGMTTQGVHRYVLGILDKLGFSEASITKLQTGGPDGDLGGNEILASNDKTLAVVDAGGVLYDPDGLDRTELRRLVAERSCCSGYQTAKLGPRGFLVKTTDHDVELPDGERVVSGMSFRNAFHLSPRVKADLFLPCGGRPRSVTLTNWTELLDKEGSPRFRWIVEGANLFLTQEARLKLEEEGVILFKDSSTNKGGVISSSLEVLVGLALSDGEFSAHMTVGPDAEAPSFRKQYIKEVIGIIVDKADREFQLLWNSHCETKVPISILSDQVSARIIEITNEIEASELFSDPVVRETALRQHTPPSLLNLVGITALEQRVPESYQRAIVARRVASCFVYQYGLDASFEDYRQYVGALRQAGQGIPT